MVLDNIWQLQNHLGRLAAGEMKVGHGLSYLWILQPLKGLELGKKRHYGNQSFSYKQVACWICHHEKSVGLECRSISPYSTASSFAVLLAMVLEGLLNIMCKVLWQSIYKGGRRSFIVSSLSPCGAFPKHHELVKSEKEEITQTKFWNANFKSQISKKKKQQFTFGVPVACQHVALHCLGNLCDSVDLLCWSCMHRVQAEFSEKLQPKQPSHFQECSWVKKKEPFIQRTQGIETCPSVNAFHSPTCECLNLESQGGLSSVFYLQVHISQVN